MNPIDQTNTNMESKPSFSDFISFKVMITPMFIKIIYSIGAILISIASLKVMFTGYGYEMDGMYGAIIGICMLAFGNLFWRIQCELMIVFFNINSTLKSIDKKSDKQN